MSPEVYKKMRTPAVEAVYQPKAGANPMIQLSLCCQSMHGPECYAIVTTVVQFRKYANREQIGPCMTDLFTSAPTVRKPGPCAALASRLERINWQWVTETTFLDEEKCMVDILQAPIQELRF